MHRAKNKCKKQPLVQFHLGPKTQHVALFAVYPRGSLTLVILQMPQEHGLWFTSELEWSELKQVEDTFSLNGWRNKETKFSWENRIK